jgi:hypothetical protein
VFVPTLFLPNPHDPFEDLALRWRRSEYLLAHHREPSPRLDDAVTHEAWRFVHDLRRCRDDRDRERLAVDHPAVTAAYQLFNQAATWKRAQMEARLLARENDEMIGKKCQMTPAVVAAYHDLFFAVRPHLQAETYILSAAIGPKAFGPLTLADRDVLLKLVCYCQLHFV